MNYNEPWLRPLLLCSSFIKQKSMGACSFVRSCFGFVFFFSVVVGSACVCVCAASTPYFSRVIIDLIFFNSLFGNNSIKKKQNVGARGSPLIKRHFFFVLVLTLPFY